MNKLFASALLGATLTLSACGGGSEEAAQIDPATNAEVPGGSAEASTSLGAGDTTSSAGAGATTGAMDGGSVAQDGDPITDSMSEEDAGAGGPADRLGGVGDGAAGSAPTPAE
jgi:hypothetical protein